MPCLPHSLIIVILFGVPQASQIFVSYKSCYKEWSELLEIFLTMHIPRLCLVNLILTKLMKCIITYSCVNFILNVNAIARNLEHLAHLGKHVPTRVTRQPERWKVPCLRLITVYKCLSTFYQPSSTCAVYRVLTYVVFCLQTSNRWLTKFSILSFVGFSFLPFSAFLLSFLQLLKHFFFIFICVFLYRYRNRSKSKRLSSLTKAFVPITVQHAGQQAHWEKTTKHIYVHISTQEKKNCFQKNK